MALVKFEGLTAGYGGKNVLESFSASFSDGRLHALVGPNGAGKSTLFRVLLKEIQPASGNVSIGGKNLSSLSQRDLAEEVSFVPQSPVVPPSFTIGELMGMASYPHRGISGKDMDEALDRCGVLALKDRLASEVSGGELQLVMLARALSCRTGIILMDEPTSSLDINHQAMMLDTARDEAKNGRNIIMSVHDLNSVLHFADDVVVLKDGRVYSSGTPEETITDNMLREVYNSRSRLETTGDGNLVVVF